MVEVGDVGGRAGSTADLDRLAERVEEAVAQRVADVGVIEAAGPARLLGEGGQFLGRGVAARRVIEAGAEPDGALGHAVAQQAAHPVEGLRRGGLVVPTDRADPQRAVPDERGDVQADRAVVPPEVALDGAPRVVDVGAAIEPGVQLDEVLEVLLVLERREPVAVDADDLGRDALADLGLVVRLGEDRETAVAVEVDEAGRDDHPGRIDVATGGRDGADADAVPVMPVGCITGRGGGSSSSRSPRMPTLPGRPGAPVPSTIVPPVISRSCM